MTNFVKRAATANLRLNLIQLNPRDERFVDQEDDMISQVRLVEELNTKQFLKQPVHLIACDYDLADPGINGFEVIRLLRNNLGWRKKILLYSANIENVINTIISGKAEDKVQKIRDLVKVNIAEFCDREEHLEEAMLKYLSEESIFSTDGFLVSELYRYGTYKFIGPYEKFENKTLGEIAGIISNQPDEAAKFKKEIMEQVIAYMIDIKNG
jgi:hypothetical protein